MNEEDKELENAAFMASLVHYRETKGEDGERFFEMVTGNPKYTEAALGRYSKGFRKTKKRQANMPSKEAVR